MSVPILETYNRAPISFVKGRGSWLETIDGELYLDMGSGIAVNCLGHSNLTLLKALEKQANLIWHTSNLYSIPVQEELAYKLVENTFADKVFFTNSGTESIECCIKMARKYYFDRGLSKKNQIVTFQGSFHGRSMAAISAAATKKLTEGFGPVLPGFKLMPFGNLDVIRALDFKRICAILIEPIQGEGGIRPCSNELLVGLRKICNEHDILLIFDEIQSGVGRSGDFFAYEESEVVPDILAVAKGIGGGFPLGCCLASEKAASGMTAGTHGSTFGGNPLACAVGLAVLNEIFSNNFLKIVKQKGVKLRTKLKHLVSKNPTVFESVRGRGLMLGLKCKVNNSVVINAAYDYRLLLVPAGDNVVRILPALNISDEDLNLALRRLTSLTDDIRRSQ
jgi:acetylornithine/N-succinyldiaminopimelate aminotransferase